VPRGRLIGLAEVGPRVWLRLQIRAWAPGERLVEGAPAPLTGVQFRAIRGQEPQGRVRWLAELLGRRGAAVLPHQERQAVRARLGGASDAALASRRVQIRPCRGEPLAWGGRHRAVPREPREDVRPRPDGWYAARGEAAAERQEAEAAFVLAKHPDRTGMVGRHGLLEAALTARLEGRDRLRGFLV
jgi:hypothetical protein